MKLADRELQLTLMLDGKARLRRVNQDLSNNGVVFEVNPQLLE